MSKKLNYTPFSVRIEENLAMEVPVTAQWVENPTGIQEDVDSIPGLTQWVKGSGIAVSGGIGGRCSSDLALLWL